LIQAGLRIQIRKKDSLKLLDLDPGVKITQKFKNYQKDTSQMPFSSTIFLFLHAIFSIRGEEPDPDPKQIGNAGSGFAINECGSANLVMTHLWLQGCASPPPACKSES
jgi:hypothetical protein